MQDFDRSIPTIKLLRTAYTTRAQLLLRWLRNVAQVELTVPLFNAHTFSIIFENIAIHHILPISRFLWLNFIAKSSLT